MPPFFASPLEQMTKAVEDAIRECGMNLNPSSEGQGQVNVPIPKATKESREAVAKVAAKHAEKVRRHAIAAVPDTLCFVR